MAATNTRRVLLGGALGGVAWTVWTMVVNVVILGSRYAVGQEAGQLLKQPRYSLFLLYWIVSLFILSFVLAWLYAGVRATRGAGPRTALKLGLAVGFAASVPANYITATWLPVDRLFPFWWMIDLWVGAILAALVAGWLYKE
ncbi:MAG: hypothetical protein HYS33_03290 [Acidobacteria bacterium]|nr:hypothetical protein [Acidobacteriota bacterium]